MFFSFPHIAIDSKGTLGAISRPGRAGPNSACGAIKASLAHLQSVGLEATCGCPGGERPRLFLIFVVARYPC